jgi:phospholipid-binding lipoprotein MlaA
MRLIGFILAILLASPGQLFAAPIPAIPGQIPAHSNHQENSEVFFDPFDDEETLPLLISDPLEPVNRISFWINDKIYTWLLKPATRAYRNLPAQMQEKVASITKAISEPVQMAELTFQLEFRNAGSEFGRFLLQYLPTAIGLHHPGGSAAGDKTGSILSRLGFDPGCYLVLPVLGPSTLREGVLLLADIYLELPCQKDREMNSQNEPDPGKNLSGHLETYEALTREALDPYLFIRTAYIQQKKAQNSYYMQAS